jgi:MFS family permease
MVSLALANISNSLSLTLGETQAILNCYLGSAVVSFILFGKLSDQYGSFYVYKLGVLTYLIGTLICSFSHTAYLLILGRIIQGFGFSSSFSMSLILIDQSCARSINRTLVLGLTTMLSGITQAVGPSLSALIIQFQPWNWIFYVELIIVFFALMFSLFSSLSSPENSKKNFRLDIIGLTLWALLILILQLSSQLKGLHVRLACLIACLLLGFLLIKRCSSLKEHSLIPFITFSSSGCQVAFLLRVMSMAYFSMILFLCPLYLQNILGYSSSITSLMLLMMTSFYAISSLCYGLLEKKFFISLRAAPLLQIFSIFLMIIFLFLKDLKIMVASLAACGISLGVAMPQSLKYFFHSSLSNTKGNAFSLFCTLSFLSSFLVITFSSLILDIISFILIKKYPAIDIVIYKYAIKVAQGVDKLQELKDTTLASKAFLAFTLSAIMCFCLCGFLTIYTLIRFSYNYTKKHQIILLHSHASIKKPKTKHLALVLSSCVFFLFILIKLCFTKIEALISFGAREHFHSAESENPSFLDKISSQENV